MKINKLCNIIRLSAGEPTMIGLNPTKLNENKLYFFPLGAVSFESQHLYAVIDSPTGIKKWFYVPEENTIFFNELYLSSQVMESFPTALKVIASTDKALGLPGFSTDFLRTYSQLGGIEEVLVVHEERFAMDGHTLTGADLCIKHDNTIIIKSVDE